MRYVFVNAAWLLALGLSKRQLRTRVVLQAADTVTIGIEPMFELNGVWYVLGNRTLNNLNLSRNGIREEGVKALLDAVLDQAAADDNAGEGLVGVFRITVQVRI